MVYPTPKYPPAAQETRGGSMLVEASEAGGGFQILPVLMLGRLQGVTRVAWLRAARSCWERKPQFDW
jgi:hypothetical protein